MDMRVQDKTAIITGGASGLGRETARYLIQDGAKVIIADQNQENIDDTIAELTKAGGKAAGFQLDVRDYEASLQMAKFAHDTYGSLDICVAAAGIGGEGKFLVDTTPADWENIIAVNVNGLINTNRAVAPYMVQQQSGSIINIASEAGKVGEKRITVYSASKGAVMSFTKALAVELGRYKIRVNAICPGVTRSPMTNLTHPGDPKYDRSAKFYPIGRLGEPEDIAAAITFLASGQSSWTTGQCISINGGFGRS